MANFRVDKVTAEFDPFPSACLPRVDYRLFYGLFQVGRAWLNRDDKNEDCPYIAKSDTKMRPCDTKFRNFICQLDPVVQEVNIQRPDEPDEIDNPANVVVSSNIETQTVSQINIVSFFESESALFGPSVTDSQFQITDLPPITSLGTRSNMYSITVPSTKPSATIPDTTVLGATISYIPPFSTAVSGAASSQAEFFESVFSETALPNAKSSSTTYSEAPLSEAAISKTGFSETVLFNKIPPTKAFSETPLSDEILPSSQTSAEVTHSNIIPSKTRLSGAALSETVLFETTLFNIMSSSTIFFDTALSEAVITETTFSETVLFNKMSSTKAFSEAPLSDEIQPSRQTFSEAAHSNKIQSSSTTLTEAAHSETAFHGTARSKLLPSSSSTFAEEDLSETASPETTLSETAHSNITPSSNPKLSETVFFTTAASYSQPNASASAATSATNPQQDPQRPTLSLLPPSVALNNSEKEELKSALSSLRKLSDISSKTLTTNSSTNETAVVPIYNLCPCSCDAPKLDLNPSPEVLADMLSRIQQKLRVNTTNLSSKKNKKISAKDGRSSSQTIAWLAVLFALIPFLIIISLDLIRLYQHIISVTRTNRVSTTKDKV